MTSNVVLHIPHSSKLIPPDIRPTLLMEESDLARELVAMTDSYTDELFVCKDSPLTSVIFPVSRLVVDPERFMSDAEEPMAAIGMGVIYTSTSHGEQLRKVPRLVERDQLLRRFYKPHHQALTEAVDSALLDAHSVLVVDCHSFPSQPLPYEFDQDPIRPDICLGSDDFHTPPYLLALAARKFEEIGLSVVINRPFSGALVPLKFYQKEPKVFGLMIEINRALYMDESTGEKAGGFIATKSAVYSVLAELTRYMSEQNMMGR